MILTTPHLGVIFHPFDSTVVAGVGSNSSLWVPSSFKKQKMRLWDRQKRDESYCLLFADRVQLEPVQTNDVFLLYNVNCLQRCDSSLANEVQWPTATVITDVPWSLTAAPLHDTSHWRQKR